MRSSRHFLLIRTGAPGPKPAPLDGVASKLRGTKRLLRIYPTPSSKSLECSSINLAAAHRVAKVLSSVRFVRKPNFSWMYLYAPNQCCRA